MDYYLLTSAGEQAGPYSLDQVRTFWANGQVTLDTPYWIEGLKAWMPLRHIESTLDFSPALTAPMTTEVMVPYRVVSASPERAIVSAPRCRVCGVGSLEKRKLYRMSTPVVIIGYILLVPSILGMALGTFIFFSAGLGASTTVAASYPVMREAMQKEQVPAPIIAKVTSSTPIDDNEMNALTDEQRTVVTNSQETLAAEKLGAGIGTVFMGGFSFMVTLGAFVGGLLGWLLVMKKRVLQCSHCRGTVAAS